MGLELRQQLKLTQQLVMTPQLQQAIKLLQLSRLELIENLNQELLENPFLDDSQQSADSPQENQLSEIRSDSDDGDSIYGKEISDNADWEDYLGDFSSTSRQSTLREAELPEEGASFESHYAARTTLEGHLEWQLRLSPLTERQKEIGELVIGNLNASGYLQATVEEIAAMTNAEAEEVETVLAAVQRFDPVGVGARTPQECLLTQIDVLGYTRDPILVGIVRDHLEDLEERRYKPLLKKFKITLDDLKDYLNIIQSLDPMPGRNYGGEDPLFVSPDVYVYKADGEYIIILNDEGLPHLSLNSMYEASIGTAQDKEREYLQEKLKAASWLIKSLHQRQRTLYKVTESIIKHQKEFFDEGISKLKPLILKDIAEDIEMHESTVSRITANKFIATPHGTFELKFFFNSALALDDGSHVGSESVRLLIKNLIAAEDPKEPLSDERLGEILKEKLKVNIARRTVAKYRTAMGIESSSKRKQLF